MLGKCLFKHKRRALFYSYHICAQDSQFNKMSIGPSTPFDINRNIVHKYLFQRNFSTGMVPAQREIMDEISRRQQNIDLGDLVLQKGYKEEYLNYINGGNGKGQNQSNKKGYQSMLAETNDEEAQKFDSMLQSKQDEIMLESLKVKFLIGLITCSKLTRRSSCLTS